MKALYVTSIENYSGKTAVVLGLGRRLQIDGHTIGYFKPVDYESSDFAGSYADEDITFVRRVFNLSAPPNELSGVTITPTQFAECLGKEDPCNFAEAVKTGAEKMGAGVDVLLLEGGGSLRQGYAFGLSTPYVAEMLDASVLAVVKYRGQLRVIDDVLTAQFRLQDRLMGVVINRVPEDENEFIVEKAIPFLEESGIPVFGVLPEQPSLAAITVNEIADTIDGQFLIGNEQGERLVKEIVVGAMGAQQALSRFRQLPEKAVVTSGDRSDVQLAALETSTACLVLTGNLAPALSVVERAEERKVPILITRRSTIGAVESIDNVFGKTRLAQADKLAFFEALMAEHIDYKRLIERLAL